MGNSHPPPGVNCWAEIDLRALAHNVRALRSIGPSVMAVLKADAYGHGVEIVAPELVKLGITDFGVASAAEGVQLRALVGENPTIYLLTASAPDNAQLIIQSRLTPFISTLPSLKCLSESTDSQNPIDVHIEIDTGIGRAGVSPIDFPNLLDTAMETPGLRVTGICTHFTSGEDAIDAASQYQIFAECLESIPSNLRKTLTIHTANSPAVLNVPDAHFDLIRPGLLLYGIAATPGEIPRLPDGQVLQPVLSLKARVILVRQLPKGTPISYERTFVLDHDTTIATAGIGYGDGYSRRFSNIGSVILPSGKLAAIRGRVCMDQLCIEIPEGETVTEGDAVILVGENNGASLRAADLAGLIDATPHEITTCITQRVPRVALPLNPQ